MIVKKIYNNNTLMAEDENQLEIILLGKGVGFQKKSGDIVDEDKIDKKFIIDSPELTKKFVELVKEIPINHVELSSKIIENAESYLGVKLHQNIFISLTDHINYALSRFKEKIELRNALLWDIKKFYPKEFKAAIEAIKTIQYYEGINLGEDEAGFIALHFVNAKQDSEEMSNTLKITRIIEDILKIVENHYGIKLDENSLNFNRFITHIQYFARRSFAKEMVDSSDRDLFDQLKEKHENTFECVKKVYKYMRDNYSIELTKEEMLYFMLHINRVTERAVS